jgi:hypothetical protein
MLALACSYAAATSSVLSTWESVYPSSTLGATYSCQVCHTKAPSFNPYGQAISDEWAKSGYAGTAEAAIKAVEPLDSDGDGYTNVVEINANTLPGSPSSHPTDTTPPSAPTGLTATAVSSTGIDLRWGASTDDTGVTGYRVYRGGALVGSPTTTAYSDTGLSPSTTYSYTVKAADAAGNLSADSNTASATTPAPPGSFGTLMGQVTDRGTTTVLVGATVGAYQADVLKASSTSNAEGIYTINQNLAAGTYDLIASAPGYISQVKARINVAGGVTTYINFFLNRSVVMGQVVAAGATTPLAGAAVGAYQNEALKAAATADANGIYQIIGLPSGSYTVIAARAGYVKQTKPGMIVTAGSITYVNFNLGVSGKLMGQVLDRVSGAPLIGAVVYARSSGVVWATGITTAPYGVYEITSDLPAGTYSMWCTHPGYQDQGKINNVVTAGATTYVNFALAPGG